MIINTDKFLQRGRVLESDLGHAGKIKENRLAKADFLLSFPHFPVHGIETIGEGELVIILWRRVVGGACVRVGEVVVLDVPLAQDVQRPEAEIELLIFEEFLA